MLTRRRREDFCSYKMVKMHEDGSAIPEKFKSLEI